MKWTNDEVWLAANAILSASGPLLIDDLVRRTVAALTRPENLEERVSVAVADMMESKLISVADSGHLTRVLPPERG